MLDDLLLRRSVRLAQFLGVGDAMQVRYGRPGPVQAILEFLTEQRHMGEIAWSIRCEQGISAQPIVGEDRIDGRFYMLRADRRELRQAGIGE